MITVTRDFVRMFNPAVKALFQDAYDAQRNLASSLATFVDSSLPQEDYSFIGQIPIMQQWTDERSIKALKEYGFTITNKKFEATIGIQREVLEDERWGAIKMRIMGLADAAVAHYDQILFSLINGNGNAYDGTAFYHANHSNLTSGASSALSATSLATGVAAMRKQKLDNGEPMDVNPTHLLVPPDLEMVARQLVNSSFYPSEAGAGKPGNMATNIWRGQFEVVVSPRLTTATEWHLLDCSKRVKPFIVQQRVPITLESMDTDRESDSVFLRDEFLYGVRSRDNAGFGLYQLAYKSAGA
jgi:phage major head subunit gpT-like protein